MVMATHFLDIIICLIRHIQCHTVNIYCIIVAPFNVSFTFSILPIYFFRLSFLVIQLCLGIIASGILNSPNTAKEVVAPASET